MSVRIPCRADWIPNVILRRCWTLLDFALDMSYLFPPDRSLLYPQFETYRLHPLDPQDDVTAHPLPGAGATQSRFGYNTHLLSFKETRARISFNHLSTDGRRGVYIDTEWNVIAFEIDASHTEI